MQTYSGYHSNLILLGRIAAAIVLILVPPIIFEKYTFYLYLTNSPNFFAYSGRRLWFDIIWFVASGAATALIVGRKKWISLLVPVLASAAFIINVYFIPFCDPRECYVSSTDGFGFLRDFLFFASLGLLACSGVVSKELKFAQGQRDTSIQKIYIFLVSSLIGYALGFFPLVHIFAGVTVPYPLNYFQWFLACAVPSFTAAFLAAERSSKIGNLRTKRVFEFLAGVSGVVLGILFDFWVPCEACSGYGISIGSILITSALFSLLGIVFGEKIRKTALRARRGYPSITVGITIIGTIVVLFFFFFSTNYQMSVVNSMGGKIQNASFSPVEVGSTFVYSGGYLSTNEVRVPAVGVSVNYENSTIQSSSSSNFLAAGVGDQSPNCCKDGLDLAYRADAVLFTNGTEGLLARAWWACDVNMACDGYSWQQLLHFQEFLLPKGTLSNWVDIQMNWTSSEIGWYYRVHYSGNGSVTPWILYASFTPPKIQNHYFDAGMIYVGSGNQPNDEAFFYQFGVSSLTEIKNTGWNVEMRCPTIDENGTWACLDHASFIGGQYGFWKVLYTFGKSYSGLNFQYLGNYTVRFYYSGSSPRDETVIW